MLWTAVSATVVHTVGRFVGGAAAQEMKCVELGALLLLPWEGKP